MSISPDTGAAVAKAAQQFKLSSLFSVTPASSNPAYLILSLLDRNEYTVGYNTAAMATLSGNGATAKFASAGGDANAIGIVFTYQASTGQYVNATYGSLAALTCTASSNTNDNICISAYGTSNASMAAAYAASPYTLEENPSYFSYQGSVTLVTQPTATQAAQATPNAIAAAAESFVGKAWNMDGCWVLASNIAAIAGSSLPASGTLVGVPGVANGEWIVAYNGPVSASANWEQNLVAGEMVGFVTTSGGGHITTVVSGTGSTAQLIDNITYENANGTIQNAANDGSANDIIVAAPHPATQEFNGVNPSDVVVYELDTPTVKDLATSLSLAARSSKSLAALFSATNPVAAQAITQYQLYDTNTGDSITLNGTAQTAAHSASTAVTTSSLASIALLAGGSAGTDTIEIRAYNGSYYGDWQNLAVTITAPLSPPTLTAQTPNQSFAQGQKITFALPANTFTDPQGQTLTYTAAQSSGAALPAWLSFNAATKTFAGTVPAGLESLTLKITATDSSGLSASETFGLTIPAAAPTLTAQTAAQNVAGGQKFNLALASNTFTDPQGQALTYKAALSTGAALPTWLTFNAATKTFSGTAPTTAQSLTLKITATDTANLSASETFSLTIPAATKSTTAAKMQFIAAQPTASSLHAAQRTSLFTAAAITPTAASAFAHTAPASNPLTPPTIPGAALLTLQQPPAHFAATQLHHPTTTGF